MIFPVAVRVQPPESARPDATCRAIGGCLPHPEQPGWCLYCAETITAPTPVLAAGSVWTRHRARRT